MWQDMPWYQVAAQGVAFFAGIYLVFGGTTWLLTQVWLPGQGYGNRLNHRPVAPGQVRRELGLSALSVLIFGVGLLVLAATGWPGARCRGRA